MNNEIGGISYKQFLALTPTQIAEIVEQSTRQAVLESGVSEDAAAKIAELKATAVNALKEIETLLDAHCTA